MFRKVFTTTHWKTYLTVVFFLCIFGILWDPPLKVSLLKGWRLKNHFQASCLASRVSNIPLVTAKGWLIRYLILRPRGWCLKAHEWDIVCPSLFNRLHALFPDCLHMGVSKNRGTPKSSILIGFSIINHPFWGTPIFWKQPYYTCLILPSPSFPNGSGNDCNYERYSHRPWPSPEWHFHGKKTRNNHLLKR